MAKRWVQIIKLLLNCTQNSGKDEGVRVGEGREARAVTVCAVAGHITL
jgi:hypothetical protein